MAFLREMKFLVDRMLGKLVKGLRMLGYDAVYYRGEDPYPLIQLARREDRVILTRNTKLKAKRPEDRIYRVAEDHPQRQLRELMGMGLISRDEERLFSRCLECNGLLMEIPRKEIEGKVPDFIYHHQEEFYRCPLCQRIYWKGSHQENMERRLRDLFQNQ